MKKVFLLFLFFLIFLISCDSRSSKNSVYSERRIAKIRAVRKTLRRLTVALFIYYVDNKKFPTTKEGIVYGLAKSGINAPYYDFKEEDYNKITRQDCKSQVSDQNNIKPGDKYITPLQSGDALGDVEIYPLGVEYYYFAKKNYFELFEKNVPGECYTLLRHREFLLFKHLPFLRYKKYVNAKCGADYIRGDNYSNVEFYIQKK